MRNACRIFTSLLLACLIFVHNAVLAQAAGYLKFNQSTYSVVTGSTIQVAVVVDPGTDAIAGTDAYVTYDSTLLEATLVTAGTYFPAVSQYIAGGKVSIWGVTEPASPKSGVGTIATITFRALKAGTGALQYFCNATSSSSSKIIKNDINATNIINCSLNQTANITAAGGSGTGLTPTTAVPTPTTPAGSSLTPTATPAATATPRPTSTPVPAAAAPTQLPRSGSLDNLNQFAAGGILLVLLGIAVRFIKI